MEVSASEYRSSFGRTSASALRGNDSSVDAGGPLSVRRKASGKASATSSAKSARRLYHAEQVMQEKKLPKKKYLATQRLRRDLERSSVESLKLDVNFLRQEIVNLRTVREIVQAKRLASSVTSVGGLMAMVAQFYEMTKYGIGGESPASKITASGKISFLRSIMDEELRFGSNVRGLDKFIAQFLGYTLFHSFFYLEAPKLVELQSRDEFPIIVATQHARVRVSRKTLEMVFPHTLADEVLVQELIGQEVLYPCETRFYFNREGKIVHCDAHVDFVAGLNKVLKSLRRVTDMMDHARLDGVVIQLDEEHELAFSQLIESSDAEEVKTAASAAALYSSDGDDDAGDAGDFREMAHAPEMSIVESTTTIQNRMSIGMLLS